MLRRALVFARPGTDLNCKYKIDNILELDTCLDKVFVDIN